MRHLAYGDVGTFRGASDRRGDVAFAFHAEDEHVEAVVLAHRHRGLIHDADVTGEGFAVGQCVELLGVRVGLRVGGVDPVNARLGHEHLVCMNSSAR